MTPHKTGSTTTPADARAAAPPTRTFGFPGADPGGPHRRLPPGLPRPAVQVRQHRPRPGLFISLRSSAAPHEPPR